VTRIKLWAGLGLLTLVPSDGFAANPPPRPEAGAATGLVHQAQYAGGERGQRGEGEGEGESGERGEGERGEGEGEGGEGEGGRRGDAPRQDARREDERRGDERRDAPRVDRGGIGTLR